MSWHLCLFQRVHRSGELFLQFQWHWESPFLSLPVEFWSAALTVLGAAVCRIQLTKLILLSNKKYKLHRHPAALPRQRLQ